MFLPWVIYSLSPYQMFWAKQKELWTESSKDFLIHRLASLFHILKEFGMGPAIHGGLWETGTEIKAREVPFGVESMIVHTCSEFRASQYFCCRIKRDRKKRWIDLELLWSRAELRASPLAQSPGGRPPWQSGGRWTADFSKQKGNSF